MSIGVYSPRSSRGLYSPPIADDQEPLLEEPLPTCESCGQPSRDLYWRGRKSERPVALLERVCPPCAGEPIPQDGPIGPHGSVAASPAAATPLGIHARAPLAHINFLTPRGTTSVATRAPTSLPEKFKIALQQLCTRAPALARGALLSLVGGERRR